MRRWLLCLLIFSCAHPAIAAISTTTTFIDQNFVTALIALPADLDKDGDIDIIGVNLAAAQISWWENNGAQAFTLRTIDNAAFNGANYMSLADINKDGELDIVFTDAVSVLWYQNPGANYNQAWPAANRAIIAAYAGSAFTFTADLDRDGEIDILSTDGNNVTWWENPGAPYTQAWTQRNINTAAVAGTNAVFAIDMDRDGDIDVISTDTANITIWVNNGDPLAANNWNTQWVVDNAFNGSDSVYAIDMDRDGDNDIVATSGTGAGALNDVAWWENAMTDSAPPAAANWTQHTIDAAFTGAASAFPVDLDFDGDLDMLGAAATGNDIVWWENNGDPRRDNWTENPINQNFTGANFVYGADIDIDGDMDVLAVASGDSDIAWWQNDEDRVSGVIGFEDAAKIDDFFDGSSSVSASDIDADGDIDLMGSGYIVDDIVWWENDGTPANGGWQKQNSPPIDNDFQGAEDCVAADMDNDGDIDAVAVASVDDELAWWENDGAGSFTKTAVENSGMNSANSLFVSDIDRDGDLDIAASAGLGDEVSWWSNDGTPANGGWVKSIVDATINGPTDVYCADVDADGDIDIIACADVDDDVVWYDNNGAEAFTKRLIDNNFNGARSVAAVDIDIDGDLDIVACGDDGSMVAWWSNDGAAPPAVWTEYTIDGDANGPECIYIADLDHDGDLDIAGALSKGDAVVWWENDGTPLAGEWGVTVLDSSFNGASSVVCRDIDNDGMIDIAATSRDDDDLSWFRNGGPDAFEAATTISDLGSIQNTVTIIEDAPAGSELTLEIEGLGDDEEEIDYEEIDVECFIATAAFGTPCASEIRLLCEFRDKRLAKTAPGRFFIKTYYRLSPPLARAVSRNRTARVVVRALIRYILTLI
jgi:hypothetical protein